MKQFIYVSSVKAGGKAFHGKCMSEIDQNETEDIYGKTKREAELKLLDIDKHSDMNVVIVRPTLVYGPRVKGNLGLMLSGIKKGWFPPLPKLNNNRSMIHVDDLIRALLLVATDERTNGEIFIASDGKDYSSRDIYETMCSISGKTPPQWHVPKFIFDIVALLNQNIKNKVNKLFGDECYSSDKLQSIGFKPQCSLKEMNESSF